MERRTFTQSTMAASVTLVWPAWAQDKWPTKRVTYIVPFPAGGTIDILGRLIGQKLGPVPGTTIVIDNKGDAGGGVGSELASRAPADGYTLLGGTISSHAINASLYPKLGYVIDGQVDMMFDTTVAGPHIQSGKVRALAVTSAKRLESMPSATNVAESGVPGFEAVSWKPIFVPAGTPKPIIDRCTAKFSRFSRSPRCRTASRHLGMQSSTMSTHPTPAFQKAEVEKCAQVIKMANVKLE